MKGVESVGADLLAATTIESPDAANRA